MAEPLRIRTGLAHDQLLLSEVNPLSFPGGGGAVSPCLRGTRTDEHAEARPDRGERAVGLRAEVYVRGGFADVTPSGLTILADQAVPLEDFNASTQWREIRNAEKTSPTPAMTSNT